MKGQWFLIAAVIASATLLAISQILGSYLVLDLSSVGELREDLIFHSIVSELNKTVKKCLKVGDCEQRIEEYYFTATRELGSRGYYLEIQVLQVLPNKVELKIDLLSERFNLSRTVTLIP